MARRADSPTSAARIAKRLLPWFDDFFCSPGTDSECVVPVRPDRSELESGAPELDGATVQARIPVMIWYRNQ